ncbi:hypothetical protein BY458DRAFT_525653 [Sporodiniella umbellata]|nr:hypothetical protein BY458DRAFT_525653 [Sporodiniella umbellata]
MLVKSKVRKSEQRSHQVSFSNLVEFTDNSKILNLEAKVMHSSIDKEIRICEGCMRRERKRSERIKDNKAREEVDIKDEKERVVLFNCNSLLNFSSSEITLPTRITCYCRHHNEKVGFRIRFSMKNDKGQVVALGTSPPIMITDDHKSPKNKAKNSFSNKGKRPREPNDLVTSPTLLKKLPISNGPIKTPHLPTSISIPHSDPIFINSLPTPPAEQLSFKRRRNVSPPFFSSLPLVNEHQTDKPSPRLDRVISAQGPTYGGTEVTLLGSGFYEGLTCVFGDRVATTTAVYPNIIVCRLPAVAHPGPVVVSFKDHSLALEGQDVVIFTYYDANDQALLELALQLIGLKTTGKLHNAKKVAMDIVQGNLYTHTQQKQEASKSPIDFPTSLHEEKYNMSSVDILTRIQT